MYLIAEVMHRLVKRRRLLMFLAAMAALITAIAAVFIMRPAAPDQSALPATPSTILTMPATVTPVVVQPEQGSEPILAPDEPNTTNYQTLAKAAAELIYTWDARSSSYSVVYERLRQWWDVLPDGSNPLTVMAQEFQATGVTAASFAALSGMKAHRTASVSSSACDGQLAQVKTNPAPWMGLHVCTFTLKVTEHQTGGENSYSVPVSVMVNCPPAASAPVDRCAMVGFYASPNRIVY